MNRYFLMDTRTFLAVIGISFLIGMMIGWGLSIWAMELRGLG